MKKSVLILITGVIALVSSLDNGTIAGHNPAPENPQGSGVYQSVADFKQGKLTLQVDCKTEKHRIKLHDFITKPYIDVIHQGKKYTFQKSEIFGIRDCEGRDFRFFHNEEYQLVENGGLVIYQKMTIKTATGGKGVKSEEAYYFSTQLEAPIQPLTKEGVKNATPGNHAFHNALDAQFHNEDVADYDPHHKMYKVNQLLLNTK